MLTTLWLAACTLATAYLPSASAQAAPSWVSNTQLHSKDGFATLRWSVSGDSGIPLFRITESNCGENQISFTDQAQLDIFRIDSGKYEFRVQACVRTPEGYADCGLPSQPLVLSVADSIDNSVHDPQPPLVTAPLIRAASIHGGSNSAGEPHVRESGCNADHSVNSIRRIPQTNLEP
jgi:hypothetical protein